MADFNIENILIKYLTGDASENDIEILSQWISDENNQEIFDEYVKAHFEISTVLQQDEIPSIKNKLLRDIKPQKEIKVKPLFSEKYYKYAAVLILAITAGYFMTTQLFLSTEPKLENTENYVTIETDGGETLFLNPNKEREIKDSKGVLIGDQKGEKIVYNREHYTAEQFFITVTVPYGRRFNIQLADGTNVHLNSGSSLRYPTFFKEGENRKVELNGEAYFDVAKDKEHPFIVSSDAMDIEVLGTQFNVTNYPENDQICTVLVEGSVQIIDDKNTTPTLLKPNHKAEWNKATSKIQLKEVDTYRYTAWMEGKFIFRNSTFKKIELALERKYNVKIDVKNKELANEFFDATFDVETIEEVLESFKVSYTFDYQITENEILIY